MKVIDLLNRIANGEEVPEDIEFRGEQYSYYNGNYTYCDENNCDRWLFDDLYKILEILNEEVELLEDKTDEIEELDEMFACNYRETRDEAEIEIVEKINELVRAVNKLNEPINTSKETNCMSE